MREIPLTHGLVALVDDEDFEGLSRRKWCAHRRPNGRFYAITNVAHDGGRKQLRMHRVILNAPPGMEVDHIDHSGLNNQRSNLRLATQSQNQANRPLGRVNTSGFKGVFFDKRRHKWQARVKANGKTFSLGYFADIRAAARAYDEAALRLFGEFALVNFPRPEQVGRDALKRAEQAAG